MAPRYLVDHSAENQIFTVHFNGLGKTHKTNFEEHLHYLFTLKCKYKTAHFPILCIEVCYWSCTECTLLHWQEEKTNKPLRNK